MKDGRVVGRGWTQPGGRPHAETEALARAGVAARGATAYVTLEPCAHHGETPPCADALIEAGVARVVAATRDPDARVDGKGLEKLENAGVSVVAGVCAKQAEGGLTGFRRRVETGLPCVSLKLASTLDGRIATASGESKWITGPDARRLVHLERARHDAVLTGVATVLADDPALTCRLPGLLGASPVRVVMDSNLRTPPESVLASGAGNIKTMIIATDNADDGVTQRLQELGVEVVKVTADAASLVDPLAALEELGARGITSVLVESGGRLAASFLSRDLVDRLVWFHAPLMIGGDGRPAVEGIGIEALVDAPRFRREHVRVIGEDIVETYLRRP